MQSPERVLGPQSAEPHTLRNVGVRKGTLSRFIFYLLGVQMNKASQIQPRSVLSWSQSHFVHCRCPWWKFQPPHRALWHQLCHKALFIDLTLPWEMPEWPKATGPGFITCQLCASWWTFISLNFFICKVGIILPTFDVLLWGLNEIMYMSSAAWWIAYRTGQWILVILPILLVSKYLKGQFFVLFAFLSPWNV